MTAVISACIFFRNIKIGEILCIHFIIEDGRKEQRFHHIMLYFSKKVKEAPKEIVAVYAEDAVTDQMCQQWFVKFHGRDFSLEDAPLSGRPVEVDSDQIKTLTEFMWMYGKNCHNIVK